MKRIIALSLCLALILICFTACAGKENYTIGIGVAETVDYDNGIIRQAVAGVVTDENGTVKLVRLDAVEYTVQYDGGEPVVYVPTACRDDEKNTEFKTDADYLEKLLEGKSKAEVEALTVADVNGNQGKYTADLLRAVLKALASKHAAGFTSSSELTMGVSLFANASADNEKGTLKLGASFAAVAAAGGKVMGTVIDESDGITVSLSDEGVILSHSYRGTKLELGDAYGMLTNSDYYGSKLAEWYDQAAAYAKSMYYKPTDRIDTIPDGVIAGCTIGTDNYRAAVIKAARRVR